jgi:hypothetical protein
VLFADNFDYQDMNHFITGVVDSDEVGIRSVRARVHTHTHLLFLFFSFLLRQLIMFIQPWPLFLFILIFFLSSFFFSFFLLLLSKIRDNKIYCHVLDKEYAARVSNLHAYSAITYVSALCPVFHPHPHFFC